jgi:hypothetical protein
MENKNSEKLELVDMVETDNSVVEERLTVEIPTEIQAGVLSTSWGCDFALA